MSKLIHYNYVICHIQFQKIRLILQLIIIESEAQVHIDMIKINE